MHRILQSLPRGVLRNFISRPVPKCREEEKEAQKVQHSRQIIQQRLSHNRAILYEVVRDTREKEEARGCGTEKDKDGKGESHQKRTFTHEFWASCGKPSYTAEVGALVILGVQLGKLYPKHQTFGEGDKNPYCPVHWFEVISDVLAEKPSLQAARKVLSNDYSLEYDSILGQHENRDPTCHSTQQNQQLSNDASEVKKVKFSSPDISSARLEADTFVETTSVDKHSKEHTLWKKSLAPQAACSENTKSLKRRSDLEYGPTLHQAGEEWNRLTQRFTSLILNQAGSGHAARGNLTEALAFWNKAECATAHFNLAVCYENGRNVDKNLDTACHHYEIAASQGHVLAQYNLAILCLEGGNGVKKDPERALRLLESAAKLGLKQAQTELGVMYTEDERRDLEKAAKLFQMAAEQKDKNGLFYLGICYENGWGVHQNYCKAAEMYRLAALDGHATAQYNLATLLEHGPGEIHQDKKAAVDMYEKAALLGEQGAEQEAKRLREEIQQLASCEHFRWQFDGGTGNLTESRSSPVLCAPDSSLAFYLHQHLREFGFADLALKLDRESSSSSGTNSSRRKSSSSSSGFNVNFQLGTEDLEDIVSAGPVGGDKFWSYEDDDMDNLAPGQNLRGGMESSVDQLGFQGNHKSLSMIELPSLRTGGSHPLRVL